MIVYIVDFGEALSSFLFLVKEGLMCISGLCCDYYSETLPEKSARICATANFQPQWISANSVGHTVFEVFNQG